MIELTFGMELGVDPAGGVYITEVTAPPVKMSSLVEPLTNEVDIISVTSPPVSLASISDPLTNEVTILEVKLIWQ